ncbi:MAG: quinone-dependent dihydroorotate dehydrogenase [Pyrinomonadaceae bacterium MAG19_C2-C3]|nr:quinone-dependent dihydroorotate dehydrogenase [Pyrinomonadaceae bacterium MAG19_C2-C3]
MIHENFLRPLLFRLPAETAHEWSMRALSFALRGEASRAFVRRQLIQDYRETYGDIYGSIERFGLKFDNPVGLAAGFDKNGEHAAALAALGFGFIETGTVTRLAQDGNPRPRLFRLPDDAALINRQGFNNKGAPALVAHLKRDRPACVLGVNIGKSRVTPIDEAVADYVASFESVRSVADYVAINVSSPNTPNLRDLQRPEALDELLAAIQRSNHQLAARDETKPLPVLVKVAPDLDDAALEMIVDVARRNRLAGIIATNTTVARDDLKTPRAAVEACGAGGLSGAPLRRRSTEIIRRLYTLAQGSLVIIGVGGVFTGRDAWDKISAGASLVQLYTGFVYGGVRVVQRINEDLSGILRERGVRSLDEAVGCQANIAHRTL